MLDPFGIDLRGALADADGAEERDDDAVTLAGLGREPFARAGEKDGAVRTAGHPAITNKTCDSANDGDVRNAERASQIDDPRFAARGDEVRDQFDVVLSGLAGVSAAGDAMRRGREA